IKIIYLDPPPGPNVCPGCDPTRNYVCANKKCVCPPGFCEDPVNKICGAQLCNPQLSFTCPAPMVCKQTPYRNHRCACPSDYTCDLGDGSCRGNVTCPANQKYNPTTRACEGCNPPCDASRNFVCQSNPKGDLECNCKPKYNLDPVSQVCTINECAVGIANCSQYANCTDKLLGFICNCWPGYKDNSQGNFPGVICEKIINPCEAGRHNCSEHARCIPDMLGGYKCECEKGFIDQYPPLSGRLCEKRINECADPNLNNCSKDADCFDLDRGYRCVCHAGYQDLKPYEEPGRFCYIDPCQDESKNDCWLKRCRVVDIQTGQFACEPCPSGYTDVDTSKPGRNCQTKVPPCQDPTRNDCDRAAYCFGVTGKPDDYTCQCRDGYLDVSTDPVNKAGRKCDIIKNPCFDATKNDCDINAYCIDLKNNRYNCSCKSGFRDRSSDRTKPGRVCKALVDECAIPQLNNCSAYANCKNKEDGYDCICKEGYVDKGPANGLSGRICEP
uniref:EGF-like domain-containing protein n=1 Tax=Romanomermis culicivorax TaxID=13658 RepID=A0A915HLL8_ROMCU